MVEKVTWRMAGIELNIRFLICATGEAEFGRLTRTLLGSKTYPLNSLRNLTPESALRVNHQFFENERSISGRIGSLQSLQRARFVNSLELEVYLQDRKFEPCHPTKPVKRFCVCFHKLIRPMRQNVLFEII